MDAFGRWMLSKQWDAGGAGAVSENGVVRVEAAA
tara:strand:+ start:25579 stop:25680 length:102 start_codon:yes stop_codon:yes gene_type:complete